MIDAHIHLDQYEDKVLSSMLEGLPEQGIESLIAVSMNLASSKRTLELAASYPGLVKPAYGFHPEQALPTEEELNVLLKWITGHADRMAAIVKSASPTTPAPKLPHAVKTGRWSPISACWADFWAWPPN